MTPLARTSLSLIAASALVFGLAVPAQAQPQPAASATSQVAATALPAFEPTVDRVARAVLNAVQPPAGAPAIEVVVDPLLDGRTGQQTIAGETAGRRIAALIAKDYPRLRLVEFTPQALARKPLVLMGTISSLDSVGQDTGAQLLAAANPKATAVWFTVARASDGHVVAKSQAQAAPETVDQRPVLAQAYGPVWLPDKAVQAYLESCRQTKVGDRLSAEYVAQLEAAALLASADAALAARNPSKALDLYRKAAEAPGGRQLRTLNGLYAALDRLGQRRPAEEAFKDLIAYGFENRQVAVKLLFRPGTPQFAETRETRRYTMWLRQIATVAAAQNQCVEVVGHTSPTGLAVLNDRLSQLRADRVRDRLDETVRGLKQRTIARGVGSRENIVGTGRDDASDALDRRVEFKPLACS